MTGDTLDPAYRVLSDEALVLVGQVCCWNCNARIEVICLYCQTGYVDGEAMFDFSVSHITRMDAALRLQLGKWSTFRPLDAREGSGGLYANHCGSCGQSQEDLYLHCQPGGVFFSFQNPSSCGLQIHALEGLVRLSGDEGYEP